MHRKARDRRTAARLALCCLLVLAGGLPLAPRAHAQAAAGAGAGAAAAPAAAAGGGRSGRRLRQQQTAQGAAVPPPGQAPLGIVVGSQAHVQSIAGTNQSFIVVPQGIIPGPVTTAGRANLQPALEACALSCISNSKCTVFNFCATDRSEPCGMDVAGGEGLPPGACEHRNQATVADGNSIILLAQGPHIETTGGIPMTIPIPSVPGYITLPGQVLLAQYRLQCPDMGSVRNDSCRLLGSLEQLVAACEADPGCQAVQFSPAGRDGLNTTLGGLHGTPGDRNATLDLRHVTWNPRAVLLVRQGTPLIMPDAASPQPPPPAVPPAAEGGSGVAEASGGGGLAAGAIAGIAIGAAAAGAALLLGFLAFRRHRREWQQAGKGSSSLAAVLTDQPSGGGGGGGSLDLAEGGGAVVHSPTAGGLSTPLARKRGSLGWLAAAAGTNSMSGSAGTSFSSAAAAGSMPRSASSGAGPARHSSSSAPIAGLNTGELAGAMLADTDSSQEQTAAMAAAAGRVPGLAPWAAQLLTESEAGWEEAVVEESAIVYLKGPDGQPISLGAGAFGSVWKVMLGGHTLAAAKVVEWGGRGHNQLEFIQEAAMLRRLRHPCIVQFLGLTLTDTRGILLMEFCPGKDLDHAMNARSRLNGARMFDWYNRGRKVAIDVASGLAYLHHMRVLHLDLKPHNILLNSDGTAKIGDVGFSRLMSRTHLTLSGAFGTFDWAAPEVLLGRGATEKSDVYSFGIVLWEMFSGTRPRRGQMPPLRVPEHCPADVAALQQACTSEDPDERPAAAQVLAALRQLPPSRRPSSEVPAAGGGAVVMPPGQAGRAPAAAASAGPGPRLPPTPPNPSSGLPPRTPPSSRAALPAPPPSSDEASGPVAAPSSSDGSSAAGGTAQAASGAGSGRTGMLGMAPAASLPSPFAAAAFLLPTTGSGAGSARLATPGSSAAQTGSPAGPAGTAGGSQRALSSRSGHSGHGSRRRSLDSGPARSVWLAPRSSSLLLSPFAAAAGLRQESGSGSRG